jgi:peptide/nickel transport system substrate-binding protein
MTRLLIKASPAPPGAEEGAVARRAVSVAILALISLMICALPARSADIRIALSSEPSSMDPHFHALAPNNTIAAHMFETLTRFDSDSQLGPALAESWRLINDTTWEFKLRKGVKFHDGNDLTAEDVAWSLDRPAAIKNSPGPFTLYTRQIVNKEIVDPLTIRLMTAVPYPLMPNDLSQIFIVSKKATQGLASEEFALGKGMAGTGPFRFATFRRGERVDLIRNDAYWGLKPAWERVTLRFVTSDPSRLAALLAGDVDAIDSVPPADFAKTKANPNLQVFSTISNRIIYFTLDQGRDVSPFVTDKSGKPLIKNPFKDLRVRQAFSKAINRQVIAEKVMDGLGVPAVNLVPNPMFGYNPALKVESYDLEGARKLLADAGYPDGFGLTIHGPNNRYVNDEQILQAVAQMLSRIGVQTKVEAMPLAVFFPRANKKEFTMALAGWGSQTGEVSSPLRSIVATTNANKGMGTINWGAYSNGKMDALLEEGLRTVDDRKREKLLRDAVSIVVADVGLIPVHYQVATWATRKGIAYTPRIDERTYAHELVVR